MNTAEILSTIARAESHRFVGRLGAEPEVRYFQSGSAVANTRMAINWPDAKRDEKDKTDWFKIEIWNEEAQAFADGAHKGDLVEVIGRIKTERYTSRDGESRVSLVIKPDTWRVLRQAGQPAGTPPPAAAPAAAPQQAQAAAPPVFQSNAASDGFDEDSIPF
jgi:single-strand DNA-binding protein